MRRKEEDYFSGYSPTRLRFDFINQIIYLGKQNDNSDDDIPIVYKLKRKETDFEDNSLFDQYFSPDRESFFHVSYNDIDFLTGNKREQSGKKEYVIDYETSVLANTNGNFLEQIQLDYWKHGYDSTNITEYDAKFNLNNPPSSGEKGIDNYKGTEGDIDFDKL